MFDSCHKTDTKSTVCELEKKINHDSPPAVTSGILSSFAFTQELSYFTILHYICEGKNSEERIKILKYGMLL